MNSAGIGLFALVFGNSCAWRLSSRHLVEIRDIVPVEVDQSPV